MPSDFSAICLPKDRIGEYCVIFLSVCKPVAKHWPIVQFNALNAVAWFLSRRSKCNSQTFHDVPRHFDKKGDSNFIRCIVNKREKFGFDQF
jgi:hypothetical protein